MSDNDYPADQEEKHGKKDWDHFRYTWTSETGSSQNTENL